MWILVRFTAFALAGAFAIGASTHVARAADSVDLVRTLAPFDQIETSGAFTTRIVVGPVQRLTIRADANLAGRVTTTVDRGKLVVGMRSGTNTFSQAPRLTIEVPALRSFENSGEGTVTITGLHGSTFALNNAGAAKIHAAGSTGSLTIELDGVGAIDTTALAAHDVTVDNNGVGSIDVRANGALTMNVNGVGEIRFTGSPSPIDQHVNGLGRISRL